MVKEISKEEWKRTHSNYKGTWNGNRTILMFVPGKGTSMVEVKVKGMRELKKKK